MRITVTSRVLDYENKAIEENKAKPGEAPQLGPLIYREVFSNALNSSAPGEPPMLPEQKAKTYVITQKVYATNEVDLTVDEAALIKEQVGKYYSPLVYGRVCELLDGKTIPDVTPEPEA